MGQPGISLDVTESTALSAFEAAWARTPVGTSLVPQRVVEYDPANLLFYAPTRYSQQAMSPLQLNLPPEQWVQDNFAAMVLGEAGSGISRGPCPQISREVTKQLMSDAIIHRYLESCENELVYSGLLEDLINMDIPLTEKILWILCHNVLGNKKNSKHLAAKDLEPIVNMAASDRVPLRFMVPAFPFKDQNPFRTGVSADHVDLGEVALLIRLHALALALCQVYPFGAEWIIVSDGVAYANIFDIPITLARNYQKLLRQYRNRLNLQSTVHIVDLDEMRERFGKFTISGKHSGNEDGNFDTISQSICHSLIILERAGSIKKSFDTLVRGMMWNINTRPLTSHYSWNDIWFVLNNEPSELSKQSEKDIYSEILEPSRQAAFKYAAYNLTMKYLGSTLRLLPSTIRATVHAKNGQVAIPLLGETYPWNGTAVLTDIAAGPSSVESRPLYKIVTIPNSSPAYLHGNDQPFFYDITGGEK